VQARSFAADHRLLLLAVLGERAVGVHLLDLLEAFDGGLDGVEIGERAAQPALGHVKLAAFLRGVLDALLRLFFGAHKDDLAALAHGDAEEIARRFELREGL